jgi:hypothetical protein
MAYAFFQKFKIANFQFSNFVFVLETQMTLSKTDAAYKTNESEL